MVAFIKYVEICLSDPEFLQEYDRLRGTSFSKQNDIIKEIDKSTGKFTKDTEELFEFIKDSFERINE